MSNSSDVEQFLFPDPAPLGVTIFLGFFMVVYLVLLVAVVTRLIMYRRHRMVRPRNPSTLVLFQLFSFVSCIVFSLSIILGKPPFCTAQDAIYILLPVFALHLNLNTPEIVFQSDLNSLKIARAQGNKDRVFTFIKCFVLPLKFVYMGLLAALQVGIFYAIQILDNPPGDCNRSAQLAYAANLLGFIVLLSYFLIRMSRVRDPFFMRTENNVGFVVSGAQILLSLIYPMAPYLFPPWFDYRWSVLMQTPVVVLVNGLFPSLLTHPPFLAWIERRSGHKVISDDQQRDVETKGTILALKQGVDVFQAVLNHPELCEAFTQFTVSEWSVENVLFYKAAEDYRRRAQENPGGMQALAEHIVEEYVVTGAPLELNLDQKVKSGILRGVKEGATAETFDAAKKSVYELMEEDSFGKWQRTLGFKAALERIVESRNSNSDSRSRTRSQRPVSTVEHVRELAHDSFSVRQSFDK